MSETVTLIARGYVEERSTGRAYFRASGTFNLARVPVKWDIILMPQGHEFVVESVYLGLGGEAEVYVENICNLRDEADQLAEEFKGAGFEVIYPGSN